MKTFKISWQYLKIRSHFYLHCQYCNGIFLCEGSYGSALVNFVKCIHCGRRFESSDSYEKCEDAYVISRLVAVIEKEEPMERILKNVRKHKNSISTKRLLTTLNKWRYLEKVMHQLKYLGLIAETNDGGSFYYITEKGRKVLDAMVSQSCNTSVKV
jgi:predicted transcriptional regulator